MDEILKCDHSNKNYWAELSCGTVYYAVHSGLTFESVDEILKCDHSNNNYWAELSCGTVYYAVHSGLTFESVDEILQSVTIQMRATEQNFPVVLFIMLYKVVLPFKSVHEILVWPLKWKLLRSTFTWYYSICFSTLNKMKFGILLNFDFPVVTV